RKLFMLFWPRELRGRIWIRNVLDPVNRKACSLLRRGGRRRVELSEANEREMAKGRHRPAFKQAHLIRAALEPMREALPRKLGAPAKLVGDRLKQVLEHAARSRIGTDPVEQNDFTSRLEDARELIECNLWMGHRVDDILRHHDIERGIRK